MIKRYARVASLLLLGVFILLGVFAPASAQEATPETVDVRVESTQASPENDASITPLSIQPLVLTGGFVLNPAVYDLESGDLTVSVTFDAGFSAENGDTIVFYPYVNTGGFMQLVPATFDATDQPISFTVSDFAITLVFDDVVSGPFDLEFTVGTTLTFNDCMTAPGAYNRVAEAGIYTVAAGLEQQTVEFTITSDESCPGLDAIAIDYVRYREVQQELFINGLIPLPLVPGQQATISYPTDKLVAEPGPFPILMLNEELGVVAPVGEAVASNGLITITISGSSQQTGWDGRLDLSLPATLTAACEPGEVGYQEVGELLFVTDQGAEFTSYVPGVLCNAAPPTKTGELLEDENGRSYILWTIDSGDAFEGAMVSDTLASYYEVPSPLDCDSLTFTPA